MSAMASQITGVSIVCLSVCLGADKRKYPSAVSLDFVRGILRWPVDSSHKWPVTQKMFPFDDVILYNFAFTGDLLEGFPACTETSLQRIWWYKTFQTRRGRWQLRSLALENKFHVLWILDAEMAFPHLIIFLRGKQWPVYLTYSSLHHGCWWFGDTRYKR